MSGRAAVRNAADEEQVKKAGKVEGSTEDRWQADLRLTLQHPHARRVAWRILNEGYLTDSCFSPNALDMAYRNGQRDVALWLEHEIMLADPKLMALIRSDAERVARMDEAQLAPETDG
jgi:hypothetical protein